MGLLDNSADDRVIGPCYHCLVQLDVRKIKSSHNKLMTFWVNNKFHERLPSQFRSWKINFISIQSYKIFILKCHFLPIEMIWSWNYDLFDAKLVLFWELKAGDHFISSLNDRAVKKSQVHWAGPVGQWGEPG